MLPGTNDPVVLKKFENTIYGFQKNVKIITYVDNGVFHKPTKKST